MTISKAFHFTFSRGWSGSLRRPLQGRVSEISAIYRAKCQADKHPLWDDAHGGFVSCFFFPAQTFFSLTKPRGQPRQAGEPAGPTGPEDPACETGRWTFIPWPSRLAI